MPSETFLNDTIVIEREDRTVSYRVNFQGKKIFGPFDMDVQEGDSLQRESTGERFVITDVERHKVSKFMSEELNHCKLKVIYEGEARRQQAAATATIVTQNIGSAHTVAGRDISGGVVTNLNVVHMLGALERAVSNDEAIPADEKKTILEQIKSLATNPFVLGVAPPVLVEAIKKQFGL